MMKKICKYLLITLVSVSLLLGYSFKPIKSLAAKDINQNETLGNLKKSLKEFEKQQQDNKNKKNKTQSEINANKDRIIKTEKELMETKENITLVENQIERTNEEIDKLKKENEDLLVLYQKLQNENVYVSYITGASSMTELIMRIDAIKQISDINNEKLNELETLIKNNEKLSKKLESYQKELDKRITASESLIDELQDEMLELDEGAVSIADEIKNLKEWIKVYEDMGCKDDETISSCINATDNKRWLKPVTQGRITSLYGPRSAPTASSGNYHRGIDIGVVEGTKVYPTANGVVGAIVYPTKDNRCGGKKLYIWTIVNGKKYTYVYMHLMEIKVSVGDTVTIDQVVALSGGGPKANLTNAYSDTCSTGAHLHYGLSDGGWWGSNNSNYRLSYFNSHTMNPPGFPGLYQWFYSRY